MRVSEPVSSNPNRPAGATSGAPSSSRATKASGRGAGEVFSDSVIAAAILDRLLHHSITINIKGESYRLREKLKAGLLKPKLGADRGSDTDASPEKP